MARRKTRRRGPTALRLVAASGDAAAATLPVPASVPLSGWRRAGRIAALTAAVVYLLGISAWLLTHGGWPTPDYLVPPLLLLAIALGRGWSFLFDWAPFLLLILSWQATAGLADQFGFPVHVVQVAEAEKWLFRGTVPTLWLQERMFDPRRGQWYDWTATIQHALHFVLPVAVGLVMWLRGRRLYWRYLISLMVVFYLGFAGYVLYPAAPPWMAGLQDVIPPVHRVAVETVLRLPASAPIGLAYTHFSANQVAAMPSLHAAVPLLLALVLVHVWGWKAAPLLLYPLTMGFNLVYLGEHYVVDVLAGYAVALVAYVLVWVAPRIVPVRRQPHAARAAPVVLPRPVRLAGNAVLPLLAVASIAVIVSTLRPGRPVHEAGPVVPGLQVQAGEGGLLAPVLCDQGGSPSLTAGNLLQPVAGAWSVYLYDVNDSTCYTLSSNVSFPPPRNIQVESLVARGPVRLAPLTRIRAGVEYFALRIGGPAQPLIDAGLPGEHRYLLLVALAGVPNTEAAALAIDDLAALAIIADPPLPEPEPPPTPPEAEPPLATEAETPPPAVTPAPTMPPAADVRPTPTPTGTPEPLEPEFPVPPTEADTPPPSDNSR